VLDDAVHFLETTDQRFDLICVDLHGNTPADWRRYAPGLLRCLARHGELLVSNVELWKIPEWADETGAQKFVNRLRWSWRWRVRPIPSGPPGKAIAKRR
jgi:spermidine synthase